MENLQSEQPIIWIEVIDPNSGAIFYTPISGSITLRNTSVSLATTASYALSGGSGGGGGGTTNTGSLLTTASFSNPNLTFTKGNGSTFNVNLSSLNPTSASYATTASYVLNAISASFASTASFINPTSTNAFVQGGNSFGAQTLLGTNDDQSLAFETSGSIRMFISSSGRISINKSSSNATLDINGSTLTSGSSTWVSPGFNNGYISPGSDGISIGNSNSGVHIRIRNSNRTNFDQSVGVGGPNFGQSTSDRITILTGGTTSGQTGLWVGSSANNNIFKVQGDSRVAINLATATSALHIQGTGSTSATTALTVQNSSTSASLVVLDNGFVGINTGSAQYNLDVNGTARTTGAMTIGSSIITGNFGNLTLSNNGVAGVSLTFTNGEWGSPNPAIFGTTGLHAHASSQVEIKSTTRGFLPPRMTLAQRTAISSPAVGLIVYETGSTATEGLWLNESTGWQQLLANTGSQSILGSLTITGGITGSLLGTASFASTASIVPSYEGAWISYTPVWTANSVNPVIGNGTIEGYYKVIGKTCFVRGNIAMGSTTTFGSGEWYVSMPFTASHADAILMTANLLDNGSAWYNAVLNGARAGFNFKTAIQYQSTGGTALDVNATQPFTWANTDRFLWNGSFEIA